MPDSPESRCPLVLMSLKMIPRIDAVAVKRRRSSNRSKNESQRMHFLRNKVPDDTTCISGLLCRKISQAFGQRFVTRLPPELLVMVQGADDRLAREGDREVALLQHLQQARGETLEHLWLIRR